MTLEEQNQFRELELRLVNLEQKFRRHNHDNIETDALSYAGKLASKTKQVFRTNAF
jgi:hypothetical protein